MAVRSKAGAGPAPRFRHPYPRPRGFRQSRDRRPRLSTPAFFPRARLHLLWLGSTFSGTSASSGWCSTGRRWSGSYASGALLAATSYRIGCPHSQHGARLALSRSKHCSRSFRHSGVLLGSRPALTAPSPRIAASWPRACRGGGRPPCGPSASCRPPTSGSAPHRGRGPTPTAPTCTGASTPSPSQRPYPSRRIASRAAGYPMEEYRSNSRRIRPPRGGFHRACGERRLRDCGLVGRRYERYLGYRHGCPLPASSRRGRSRSFGPCAQRSGKAPPPRRACPRA